MGCGCPEDPDMYWGTICHCEICEYTIISEEGKNIRICKRCKCDRTP